MFAVKRLLNAWKLEHLSNDQRMFSALNPVVPPLTIFALQH